jgi:hypothetical protein
MNTLWQSAPADLQAFKLYMIEATHLAKDALHIYAGLALFIGVRLIWRRRGGWVLGWLAALAAALIVEWLDMRTEALEANLQPDAEHWKDIWNTMFWPTVLLLVGPWLQPRCKVTATASSSSADQPLNDGAEQPPTV